MASSASDLYESTFSRAKRSFEEEGERRGSPAAGFSKVSSDEGSRAFESASKGNALTYATAADSAPRGASIVAGSLASERASTNQALMNAFAQLNQPRSGGSGDDGLWSAVGTIGGGLLGGPVGSAIGAGLAKWLG